MKKMITIVFMLGTAICSQAQSSQNKLYIKQIAANKIYIEYLQKGYRIARKGLTLIGNIQNGEFNLHRDFFSSLKGINPKIKNMSQVADMITARVKIIGIYKTSFKKILESDQFTPSEIEYIHAVFKKLLADTAALLEELLKLMTSDKYQMTDNERIKRIEELYTGMQDNCGFVQKFSNEMLVLGAQRMKEKQDVETSRALYGLPQQP